MERLKTVSPITHVCCVCGFKWQSPDHKTERHLLNAVKVNKDGPYCDLCHHIVMARRYAGARGIILDDAIATVREMVI